MKTSNSVDAEKIAVPFTTLAYSRAFCTLPSFVRIKRPRWRPVELNDRHLRSHGKIGDYEQFIPPFPYFILRSSCTRYNLHKNGCFHTTSSRLATGLVKLLQNCAREVANSQRRHFSSVCFFFNKEQMDFCLLAFVRKASLLL